MQLIFTASEDAPKVHWTIIVGLMHIFVYPSRATAKVIPEFVVLYLLSEVETRLKTRFTSCSYSRHTEAQEDSGCPRDVFFNGSFGSVSLKLSMMSRD
jgi:hypothetical protein